jgi:hypothetical protein
VQTQGNPWWDCMSLLSSASEAKAAVRAELLGWGLRDATVDPGEVLLRLVPSQPLERSVTPCCSRRRTKLLSG